MLWIFKILGNLGIVSSSCEIKTMQLKSSAFKAANINFFCSLSAKNQMKNL